jgi:hypothetical protein
MRMARFGNQIDSPGVKGMTLAEPDDGKANASDTTMFLDRRNAIRRTGGMEAAAVPP